MIIGNESNQFFDLLDRFADRIPPRHGFFSVTYYSQGCRVVRVVTFHDGSMLGIECERETFLTLGSAHEASEYATGLDMVGDRARSTRKLIEQFQYSTNVLLAESVTNPVPL